MLHIGKRDVNLGIKKRSVGRRLSLGPVSIKLIIIVLLIVFSFFYLSQSSQSATRNYVISDLQDQKEKMEAAKAQLEVDGNRLKALSLIQDKAKEKGMEQISQ